jgi:hypothetical protein
MASAPMMPSAMPAPTGGASMRSRGGPPAPPAPEPMMDMMAMEADADDEAPSFSELRRESARSKKAAPPRAAAPARAAAPPPPPAPRPAPAKQAEREERAEAAPQTAPDAQLAQTQGADGSFGHDPRRTAAALLVLLLCGSTRFKGIRRRAVAKAAAALEPHRALAEVSLALDALAAAESGAPVTPSASWRSLGDAGPEGAALLGLLR